MPIFNFRAQGVPNGSKKILFAAFSQFTPVPDPYVKNPPQKAGGWGTNGKL
jgi:hypothetical protein